MTSITAICKQGPRAANDSGPRKASQIKWVIIHSAEAADVVGVDTTAEGVANYFAQPSTQASTQLAVDSDSCVRMLPDLVIPWGAKGANTAGLHIEICGRAKWFKSYWLMPRNKQMLERAAYKAAMWCYHYDIPTTWIGAKGLRSGKKGFATHKEVNDAFGGGDHWDPGGGFPKVEFMAMVKVSLKHIKASRNK